MEVTHQDIALIKTQVGDLSRTLNEVHTALVGNQMTRDGGLIQRVIDSESEVEKLKLRILELESKNSKTEFYVKVIWTLAGGMATLVFTFILKLIFKQ